MAKGIHTWKDCTDSKRVERFARSRGVSVREGRGSHIVMERNGLSMTCYRGTMSVGVACQVFKFFVKLGLVGLLVCGVVHLL